LKRKLRQDGFSVPKLDPFPRAEFGGVLVMHRCSSCIVAGSVMKGPAVGADMGEGEREGEGEGKGEGEGEGLSLTTAVSAVD
jgi:hypothetical protein